MVYIGLIFLFAMVFERVVYFLTTSILPKFGVETKAGVVFVGAKNSEYCFYRTLALFVIKMNNKNPLAYNLVR